MQVYIFREKDAVRFGGELKLRLTAKVSEKFAVFEREAKNNLWRRKLIVPDMFFENFSLNRYFCALFWNLIVRAENDCRQIARDFPRRCVLHVAQNDDSNFIVGEPDEIRRKTVDIAAVRDLIAVKFFVNAPAVTVVAFERRENLGERFARNEFFGVERLIPGEHIFGRRI